MRNQLFAAVTTVFTATLGLTGSASAALDGTSLTDLSAPAPADQTSTHLPTSALALGEPVEAQRLDSAKNRAAQQGIYVAATDIVMTDGKFTDTMLEANVVSFGAIQNADPMNLRFYGSLLIFAAGCMMYVGLTVRRHP